MKEQSFIIIDDTELYRFLNQKKRPPKGLPQDGLVRFFSPVFDAQSLEAAKKALEQLAKQPMPVFVGKDFEDAYAFSAAIKAAATNADFFRIAEEFWQKRGLKLPPSPYEGLI